MGGIITSLFNFKNKNKMTQEQAIQVLIQAVLVGQSKGAYTIDEAVIIKQAIDAFKTAPQGQSEVSAPETAE